MKKRKIIYRLEGEIRNYDCEIMARDWYHLKIIIDGLLHSYRGGDIISIEKIEECGF